MAKPESTRLPKRLLPLLLWMVCSGAAWAEEPAVPDVAQPQLRVANIGYRLASRNRGICPRLAPVTGLLLHDLGAYEAKDRPDISARFGMRDGVGVLAVVPGSPADRAGLVAGDEIIALNNVPIARLGLPAIRPAASYDRIESFEGLLRSSLANGNAVLGVRRAERTRTVPLPSEAACAAPVALVPGSKPDAWSDARFAAVTRGLEDVAGDDELAFALAHEMAHVLLRHAAEPHGMLTGIGIGGKRSREREREADKLGMQMVLGAGYAPSGARALLERFARVNAPAISLTHPSVRARLQALDAEVRRLSPE